MASIILDIGKHSITFAVLINICRKKLNGNINILAIGENSILNKMSKNPKTKIGPIRKLTRILDIIKVSENLLKLYIIIGKIHIWAEIETIDISDIFIYIFSNKVKLSAKYNSIFLLLYIIKKIL